MLLGDLGADVIKVERPGGGDDTRGWGPPFDAEGRSAYFLSVNRNKFSVAADLSNAQDRDLVLELAHQADVVLDNFRPGTLERLGISPERICAARPSLVWCTIGGFDEGSDRPGYDFVVQAECGWMAITGAADGEPMKVGVALADVLAGKDAAIAVLARVGRPDTGGRVRVSLAASALSALVNVGQNVLVSGRDASRWGNAHPNLVPYQAFRAADRVLVIAVGNDAQWTACARALGLDGMAADAALAKNAGRVAQRDRVVSAIERVIATRDAAHWQRVLDSAGVPNGVVRTVLEAIRDVDASALTGMPSSVGGAIRRPPPFLDEHGALVRARGWAAFAAEGV